MRVRGLVREDWPAVAEIYAQGIAAGHATFETRVPSWPEWDDARIDTCRLVADQDGVVVGFAALSPVSKRPVYCGVAEVMVYVGDGARGHRVGTALLQELVRASEGSGIWSLQASIFPENEASLRAHARAGFRVVGRHERIGRFHDGRWRDTVRLERRSGVVG